jgi:hypothetical protein
MTRIIASGMERNTGAVTSRSIGMPAAGVRGEWGRWSVGVQEWDTEALARLGNALSRVQGTGVEVCKDQLHMKRAERLLDGSW